VLDSRDWASLLSFDQLLTMSGAPSAPTPTPSGGGGGANGANDATDRAVEMWKVKKLIKSLQAARG
jgi:hypothetical protein